MKYETDALVVVEGNNDKSYLSSYIKSYYFVTDGFDINDTDLSFLKLVSKRRKIILLLDPDEAGEKIKNKIKAVVKDNTVDIFLSYQNDKNKHGVFECPIEIIIKALKPYFSKMDGSYITINDLVKNNIYDDKKLKDKIKNFYYLGQINNKQLIYKLNILKIEIEELKQHL